MGRTGGGRRDGIRERFCWRRGALAGWAGWAWDGGSCSSSAAPSLPILAGGRRQWMAGGRVGRGLCWALGGARVGGCRVLCAASSQQPATAATAATGVSTGGGAPHSQFEKGTTSSSNSTSGRAARTGRPARNEPHESGGLGEGQGKKTGLGKETLAKGHSSASAVRFGSASCSLLPRRQRPSPLRSQSRGGQPTLPGNQPTRAERPSDKEEQWRRSINLKGPAA